MSSVGAGLEVMCWVEVRLERELVNPVARVGASLIGEPVTPAGLRREQVPRPLYVHNVHISFCELAIIKIVDFSNYVCKTKDFNILQQNVSDCIRLYKTAPDCTLLYKIVKDCIPERIRLYKTTPDCTECT